MPITSLLTSLIDFSGTPTLPGYGGGQGATVNDDIIIEGGQSAGRRVDNTANKRFGGSFTAANLSAAGVHAKVWLFITQWSSVTKVQVRASSGADDDHEFPTDEYPALGGWVPVWFDISRTPEVGGSANEAAINEIGVLIDIGDVGGNAQNLILDEIMYGTSGLRWDGASGDLQDFRDYENTNNEGNLVNLNGVDFVYSRLEIGSATATTFTDSDFTIIFPAQDLVSSTFMGLTFDLQNASTSISLSNGSVQNGNVSKLRDPNLDVSGTSGSLTLTDMNFSGFRSGVLTSGVTISGGQYDFADITQGGADISDARILCRTGPGVALIDDADFTKLSGITFVRTGAGHAIEITSPGTYSLDALTFENFGADETTTAAIYNNSGGAVTLNISGAASPTVRNGTGATTVVSNPATLSFTGIPNGLEGRVKKGAVSLFHEQSITGNTFTYTYNFSGVEKVTVTIGGVADDSLAYERQTLQIELAGGDVTIPLSFELNPSYT